MVSCFELEDEDDVEDEQIDAQKASPSKTDDKVIIILRSFSSLHKLEAYSPST